MRLLPPPPAAPQYQAPQRAPATYVSRGTLPKWDYLEWFIILQFALPAILCIKGTQVLRMPIRVIPFALSIVPLFLWVSKHSIRQVPGHRWLIGVLVWMGASIFHPLTNTFLAGLAQTTLNLAIIAPVFWVPQLVKGTRHIERLLVIVMFCNGASAAVGILQVHYPDRFMPEFTSVLGAEYLAEMVYEGADGVSITRPPGLTDSPGAACGSGVAAAMLGVIFLLGKKTSPPLRLWSVAFILIGTTVIYFTLVRTSILVLAGSSLVFCGIQARQGEGKKAIIGIILSVAAFAGGLTYAVSVGGEKVEKQFKSLLERRPGEIYYESRGQMVEHGFTEYLFDYPLGAGLARWGQMRGYFGNESNTVSFPIWAEVQFPCWILDGGAPLLIMYIAAILTIVYATYRLAMKGQTPDLRYWGGAILAINCGAVALCFSYAPFNSQLGTFFWLQSGLVLGGARCVVRSIAPAAQPRPIVR